MSCQQPIGLYEASKQGIIQDVRRFKLNHDLSHQDLYDAFVAAISNGHKEVVDELIDDPRLGYVIGALGKRPDPKNITCIHYAFMQACEQGHQEIVKRLLEDTRIQWLFNEFKSEAITLANQRAHWKTAQELKEFKVPRLEPHSPLHLKKIIKNFLPKCTFGSDYEELPQVDKS